MTLMTRRRRRERGETLRAFFIFFAFFCFGFSSGCAKNQIASKPSRSSCSSTLHIIFLTYHTFPMHHVFPRLSPQEKYIIRGASSIQLPGAIETASGDVFHYKEGDYGYDAIVKLITWRGTYVDVGGTKKHAYKPKRRSLAWVMRLIHEIYDVRYAQDTSDIGNDDGFDGATEEELMRRKEKEVRREERGIRNNQP